MKLLIYLSMCLVINNVFGSDIQDMIKSIDQNENPVKRSFSKADIDDIKELISSTVDDALLDSKKPNSDESKEFNGYQPADLYNDFHQIIQSNHLGGLVRDEHYADWVRKYKALFNETPPPPEKEPETDEEKAEEEQRIVNFWKEKYIAVFEDVLNQAKNNPPACVGVGQNSTTKLCCAGLITFSEIGSKANVNGNCFKAQQQCNKNSDCCSDFCDQDNPDTPGKCAVKTTCYEILNKGDTCAPDSPFCRDSECYDHNKDILGILECKSQGQRCKSNDDCCSNTCAGGYCKSKMQCLKCRKDNGKIKAGEECCPGYLKIDDKCMPPIPVYVPTVKIEKSILEKVINIIFPSAVAATFDEPVTEEERNSLTEPQKLFIEQKRKECEAKQGDKEECLQGVHREEVGFIRDQDTGLTQDQMNKFADLREECTKDHNTNVGCSEGEEGCKNGVKSNPEHLACMAEVDEKEKDALEKNSNDPNFIQTVNLKKENYISEFNIPGVTAKTYSDPKRCEFNTFNDSWRDASARERNAEVFLRSFEFVYSNDGVEDYWEDPDDSKNRNIFKRANDIAKAFRENRRLMIQKSAEIDVEVTCKCIALFGFERPEINTPAKKQFFKDQCGEFAAELQDDVGSNDDSSDSRIGNTVLNSTGDNKTEKDLETIEQLDKGASGIKYNRLLYEFSALRAEMQVERFVNNSELEEELDNLSQFITDTNFYEVYKDRIAGKKIFQAGAQKGNSHEIYRWGYEYKKGWFTIVVGIVAGALTGGIGWGLVGLGIGAGAGLVGGGIFSSLFKENKPGGLVAAATVVAIMAAAWQYNVDDEIDSTPTIKDVSAGKKKKYGSLKHKRSKGYIRFFLGPRFDNEARKDEHRCLVMSRATSCVRSAYVVPFGEADTLAENNNEKALYNNYILDPTIPLFTPPSTISKTSMPNSTKTLPQMINDATTEGVDWMKTRKPGGCVRKWGCRYGKDKNHGKYDVLGEAIKKGHFLPEGGNYVPVPFGERKEAIINAAERYALCQKLSDPTNRKARCDASELDKGEIGFGYLFESKLEAREFANYTYEIHYKWAHLTKEQSLGYPAVGKARYFQQVSYNMRLAGSLAAARAVGNNEAAQLYRSAWEASLKDYQGAKGAATVGKVVKSLKYQEKGFFDEFGALTIGDATRVSTLGSSASRDLKTGLDRGSLSGASLEALNAAKSKAIRRARDIQKKQKFDTALLKAGDDVKRLVSKNKAALDKANAPLTQFDVAKLGGGGNGFKKLNNAINNLNKSLGDFNKNNKNNSSGNGNVGGQFSIPKFGGYDLSGGSSFGSTSDFENSLPAPTVGNNKDTGLNSEQVTNLIESLSNTDLSVNENDTLFKVISKAYKRNYSRVLTRVRPKQKKTDTTPIKNEVKDSEKERLKKLLNR